MVIETTLWSMDSRCEFLHLAKNGGTSFVKQNGLTVPNGHPFADSFPESVKLYCFWREPLSRFLSAYRFARQEKSMHHDNASTSSTRHPDFDLCRRVSPTTVLVLACLSQFRLYRFVMPSSAQVKHPGFYRASHYAFRRKRVNYILDLNRSKSALVELENKTGLSLRLDEKTNASQQVDVRISKIAQWFHRCVYAKDYSIWNRLATSPTGFLSCEESATS
jgi:hypothetical protein